MLIKLPSIVNLPKIFLITFIIQVIHPYFNQISKKKKKESLHLILKKRHFLYFDLPKSL